ncbi:MBL fold metallo-hydrolase [Lewinella sp. W8]|uniref:MBL fold metallo-hydrolase n=1 Tax=Lewinella sp. W8 TaxID=2528208 RepID=UPI00106887B6|nr:MBL fold metallo-hydrolase [Lewinella sp. W8]MTB51564.1 hypothetical protein [Lewinella sp. W8]
MNLKRPHWLAGLAMLPLLYAVRKLRNDPQFGAKPSAILARNVRSSSGWRRGSFRNLERTPIQEDLGSLLGDLYGYLKSKHTQPTVPLPVAPNKASAFPEVDQDHLTWYGHSTVRLETGGKTILFDPMLGDWVAPIPFLGHRFPYENYQPLEDFGEIDLIVYSHDHYDHLDFDTLMALKDRTRAFLVPLGVGAHLRAWGISEEKITEIDWWESVELTGCRFTATPARHFSGRSPATRNKTLWCGYAIDTRYHRLYFGGDSGYGSHFRTIGQRLGKFDLTMLDSGQYHARWKNIHMQPEEALRAHQDLGGRALLPIHWGAFSLSNHPWFDPAERIIKADQDECVLSPMVGQRFAVNAEDCKSRWWQEVVQRPSIYDAAKA